MPFRALQSALPSVGAGSLTPPDCDPEVEVAVVVVATTVVSVLEELAVVAVVVTVPEVTVLVDEDVQVAGPSSLPVHPAPANHGIVALEVLSPIASEATRNTNTNPTRARVAFLVLSFAVVEEKDRVIMSSQYGSQIYIIALCDFEILKVPNSSRYILISIA